MARRRKQDDAHITELSRVTPQFVLISVKNGKFYTSAKKANKRKKRYSRAIER